MPQSSHDQQIPSYMKTSVGQYAMHRARAGSQWPCSDHAASPSANKEGETACHGLGLESLDGPHCMLCSSCKQSLMLVLHLGVAPQHCRPASKPVSDQFDTCLAMLRMTPGRYQSRSSVRSWCQQRCSRKARGRHCMTWLWEGGGSCHWQCSGRCSHGCARWRSGRPAARTPLQVQRECLQSPMPV